MKEDTFRFEDPSVLPDLFGVHDSNLKTLEKHLGVEIRPGGDEAHVSGDPIQVEIAGKVLSGLYRVIRRGIPVAGNDVVAAVRIVSGGPERGRLRGVPGRRFPVRAEPPDHAQERRTEALPGRHTGLRHRVRRGARRDG